MTQSSGPGYTSQIEELTRETLNNTSALRRLQEQIESLQLREGEGIRIRRDGSAGVTIELEETDANEYQGPEDAIISVSYDSGTSDFTVILRGYEVNYIQPNGTNWITTTLSAQTFTFNDPAASNTVSIYMLNSEYNSTPRYKWIGTESYGTAGADATTQDAELTSYFGYRRIARVTLTNGGTYTIQSGSEVAELDMKRDSQISQPCLSYSTSSKTLYLTNFGLPETRVSGGSGPYWLQKEGVTVSVAVPVSTTSAVYFGVGYTETGTTGHLQLNTTGLDTYKYVGLIATDADGHLKALKDFTQEARFVPLGITDTFTIDTPRGTETLQFIDGILVSRT
jgi:hypothetical protein